MPSRSRNQSPRIAGLLFWLVIFVSHSVAIAGSSSVTFSRSPSSKMLTIKSAEAPTEPYRTTLGKHNRPHQKTDLVQTVFSDGFEGSFPGVWNVFDGSSSDGRNTSWGLSTYRRASGSRSVWCVGGGANPVTPGGTYPNNTRSWMVYGPFDLSDAIDAELVFKIWSRTEPTFDEMGWYASVDNVQYYGYSITGDTQGWIEESLDLTAIPTLGDLRGRSTVYIAFVFESDVSVVDEGSYLDEVTLRKTVMATGADLAIEAIDIRQSALAHGDPFQIDTRIRNLGDTSSGSYSVRYYASRNSTISSGDTDLGALLLDGLGPGGVAELTAQGSALPALSPGLWYFGAIIEDDDVDNSNNIGVDHRAVTVSSSSPQSCQVARTISCGSPIHQGNNGWPGSTDQVSSYACNSLAETGPEYAYRFQPDSSGTYTVDLDGLAADLDLFVLGPRTSCDPTRCLGSSVNGTTNSERVTFQAAAGQTYHVVVDGYSGAVSNYTLELQCPATLLALFAFDPTNPVVNEAVQFADGSIGNPASWNWRFGDGSTSTARNPVHRYTSPGTYVVTLTVSDPLGNQNSTTRTVTVSPTQNGTISISGPSSTETNQIVAFQASSQDCAPLANQWEWSSGGGIVSSSGGSRLTVRWSTPGRKRVNVSNPGCGNAVGERFVEVLSPPQVDPPAAPSDLTASALSSTSVDLVWRDNSNNEDAFHIEQASATGPFSEVAVVPANVTSTTLPNLLPSTTYRFRIRARNSNGTQSIYSVFSSEASVATPTGSCRATDTSLCLTESRFKATVEYQDENGNSGPGRTATLSTDTGYFWFYDEENVEVLIKVLDGRQLNGHFWVFYAGLSNVEFTLTVTDTETASTATYFNPSGRFASRGDTSALPGLRVSTNPEFMAVDHLAFSVERDAPGTLFGQGSPRLSPSGTMTKNLGVEIDWSPMPVHARDLVLFTDNQPTGEAYRRFWNFGDGSTLVSSSDSVEHRYASSGRYDVSLTVTKSDLLGETSETVSRFIQVLAEPDSNPTIRIAGPTSSLRNSEVTFSATASDCDPKSDGWSWNVSGGSIIGNSRGSLVKIRWSNSGNKTVSGRNTSCGDAVGRRSIQILNTDGPGGACQPDATTQCLNDRRFEVTVDWRDSNGARGAGRATPLTNDTGYFWFFDSANVELVVKILDGRMFNNHFWVFYGAMSNVEYTIRIFDRDTGRTKTYFNPLGSFSSNGDTTALPAN